MLTDPTTQRREGTVWVMVLLSDGAAGRQRPPCGWAALSPHSRSPTNRLATSTGDGRPDYGTRGEYGFYGLCPTGNPGILLGELLDSRDTGGVFDGFPFCSDESVSTRHFCAPDLGETPPRASVRQTGCLASGPNTLDWDGETTGDRSEQNIYAVDIGQVYPNDVDCDALYDVDDYAP